VRIRGAMLDELRRIGCRARSMKKRGKYKQQWPNWNKASAVPPPKHRWPKQ
jgi:hypothetical protein